jgi:hypothetical protein
MGIHDDLPNSWSKPRRVQEQTGQKRQHPEDITNSQEPKTTKMLLPKKLNNSKKNK